MGLMDKAKEAALQAKAQAQHMAQQGQAKVASVQQGRSEGELLRALGEAYYNEQRHGGDHEAVTAALAALAALDAHHAAAPAATPEPPPPGAGTPPPGGGSPPAGSPPPGDFTLDDV